jgi:hypothetical protein
MPFDDAGALNLHFAAGWGHRQHATALAFVATGDQHDLIVLLYL